MTYRCGHTYAGPEPTEYRRAALARALRVVDCPRCRVKDAPRNANGELAADGYQRLVGGCDTIMRAYFGARQ